MKKVSKEEAIKLIRELEKAKLMLLSKEELVERMLSSLDVELSNLTEAQVSGRISELTNGEVSVDRTDIITS